MTNFKNDYNFWIENEDRVIKYLKSQWYKIEKQNDSTSIHDFTITFQGKPVNIELKTRRCNKESYVDTIIWANKLACAWEKFYSKGEETLFFFSYEDWLYFINPFDYLPRREFKLQRYDRKIDSPKWWIYFKTKNLKKIIWKKNIK